MVQVQQLLCELRDPLMLAPSFGQSAVHVTIPKLFYFCVTFGTTPIAQLGDMYIVLKVCVMFILIVSREESG